jgi:hypothetical protein
MFNDNIDLVDLLFENDDCEYLEEANIEGLHKFIKNLFGHMLKFIYQPERQSRGWVVTIGRSINEIRDVFTKDPNKINEVTNEYLDNIFVEALHFLYNQTGIKENIPRYDDWDIDFIQNKNSVVNSWLYACTEKDNIKEYIDRYVD